MNRPEINGKRIVRDGSRSRQYKKKSVDEFSKQKNVLETKVE